MAGTYLDATSVGISDNDLTLNTRVFPNPASNTLNIYIDKLTDSNSEIKITSMTGQEFYSEKMNGVVDIFEKSIDVNFLSDGI